MTIGGTQTSAGFIPHLHRFGIDMPVALHTPKHQTVAERTAPQKPDRDIDGKLQYVAPGGKRVMA